MPELPEVETVCRHLAGSVVGQSISDVFVRQPNLRLPTTAGMEQALKNRKIREVVRQAKYINCTLDNKLTLVIHLGMSGRLIYRQTGEDYNKHDHIIISFYNGDEVAFNDPRRFGLVLLLTEDERQKLFNKLGVEPLTPHLNLGFLNGLLQGKKCNIKSFLLDSHNIVGIGNIYASEILFQAKILPTRSAGSLLENEIAKLLLSITAVLNKAILAGGSTLKDYATPSGEIGNFQKSFAVYSRGNQPCGSCEEPIHCTRQNGRSTFFCPVCQK